jgi:hypothetical protein
LNKLDGRGSLAGWRWIFIVEGLLTSVSGLMAFFIIPNWPERGTFLSDYEKELLALRLARDVQQVKMDRLDWKAFRLILSDWKVHIA